MENKEKKLVHEYDNLTYHQQKVCRDKGTEMPFSGKYWNTTEDGDYACSVCGQILFKSNTKFDAGCGWPSFFESEKNAIRYEKDTTHGMIREEVMCSHCHSHLGHIFDDGPQPTGKRFCINSISLDFNKKT